MSAKSSILDIPFIEGKCRFRVHQKSVDRMKNKIRELTDRNKSISNEVREKKYQEYVRGWVEYFRLADMKGLLKTTDEWARRRIRAVYWKQWKKIKTKYRMLKAGRVSVNISTGGISNIGSCIFQRNGIRKIVRMPDTFETVSSFV